MAKVKTSPYGLKHGHPMPFRRTIKTVKKPYQLVFEPGKPLDLNDSEIDGLAKEIEGGLIVPWEVSEHDHRKRSRPLRLDQPSVAVTDEIEEVDQDIPLGDEE